MACGAPLPQNGRSDQRFCRDRCRVRAHALRAGYIGGPRRASRSSAKILAEVQQQLDEARAQLQSKDAIIAELLDKLRNLEGSSAARESKYQEQKAAWRERLERVQAELEAERATCARKTQEAQAREQNARSRLAAAQNQLSEARRHSAELEQKLQKAQQSTITARASLTRTEEQVARLKKSEERWTAAKQKMKDDHAFEVHCLQSRIAASEEGWARSEAKLRLSRSQSALQQREQPHPAQVKPVQSNSQRAAGERRGSTRTEGIVGSLGRAVVCGLAAGIGSELGKAFIAHTARTQPRAEANTETVSRALAKSASGIQPKSEQPRLRAVPPCPGEPTPERATGERVRRHPDCVPQRIRRAA